MEISYEENKHWAKIRVYQNQTKYMVIYLKEEPVLTSEQISAIAEAIYLNPDYLTPEGFAAPIRTQQELLELIKLETTTRWVPK